MNNHSHLIDIDPGLVILRIQQGVKLVKPEQVAQATQSPLVFNTGHTVASLATLPFNFYFLNRQGETLHMNQQCVEICGFQSMHDSLGKSLHAVSDPISAQQLISNCDEVVVENKIKIFEEQNIRKDGVTLHFLSVKSPWYNDVDQVMGIFGCSIVLGQQSLAESLQQISQLGLLNPTNLSVSNTVVPSIAHGHDPLSERESLCVFHLCKGFTMKEIAKIIGLSPKTVETYIDRAKQKFKCQSKAELITAFVKETHRNG